MTRAARGALRWERAAKPFLARIATRGVDLARRPLEALGVDVARMRAIVETKVTLDARAEGGAGMPGFGLLLFMALAWLSSLPIGVAAVAKLPPDLWMSLISAHATVLLGFLLVTQLVPILVDASDIAVVGSCPVSDRTLFAARLAHLGTYVVAIALPSAFWPLFLGWLGYPYHLVLVAVPTAIALSAANAIGGTALFFALALRVVGPERFQRLAFWLQIAAAVFVMGGWRVLLQLLPHGDAIALYEAGSPLRFLLPPFQIGAGFALLHGDVGRANVLGTLLAFATPLAAFWFAFAFASRTFAASLASDVGRPAVRQRGFARTLLQRIGARLCPSRAERAGFDLGLALGRRDRAFLRAALPALIGLLLPALINVVPSRAGVEFHVLRFLGLIPLYLSAIFAPLVLESMRLSETPDARWLYAASPLSNYREITRGVAKALVVALALPVMLGLVALIALVGGLQRLPDALFAATFAFALGLAFAPRLRVEVPFSRGLKAIDLRFDNVPAIFGLLLLAAVAFGLHAAVRLHWASYTLAAVLVALFAVWSWRRFQDLREPAPLDPSEPRIGRAR